MPEISEKEAITFLRKLITEINSQGNRATASPYYFEVQTQVQVVCDGEDDGAEMYYFDDEPWTDEDLNEMSATELKCNFGISCLEEIKEGMDTFYQKYVYEGRGIFLTEKAADIHIAQNDYHYHNPRTYVKHFWRNAEMDKLLQSVGVLCGINWERH